MHVEQLVNDDVVDDFDRLSSPPTDPILNVKTSVLMR